ncbi:hypothetical protein GCM10027046_23880 [Uliginosibacterium flavum]|uniref:Uncharacterized protein n=1 Tax=Uliginosibacterium flavum TaxID=1396831 RepID=A0ABV2TK84_9RHOO
MAKGVYERDDAYRVRSRETALRTRPWEYITRKMTEERRQQLRERAQKMISRKHDFYGTTGQASYAMLRDSKKLMQRIAHLLKNLND